MRQRRARETSKEREVRLCKKREDSARRRSTFKTDASDKAREAQREYERNKKKEQRARESSEQREARLQKMRAYQEGKRREMGCEKKAPQIQNLHDLHKYEREQKRAQRERETAEQKEKRLQKAREYKATYKAKSTPEEREKTRERVAAHRAKRTDEEKKRDNEAAKLRMARLKSNRSAPHWNGDTESHDENCRVRKWRLLMAQGTDAGPEPMLTDKKGFSCHICDQDPDLPLAGIGRCPCYDCAVLHGKVDEWMKIRGKKVDEWKKKCEKKSSS